VPWVGDSDVVGIGMGADQRTVEEEADALLPKLVQVGRLLLDLGEIP